MTLTTEHWENRVDRGQTFHNPSFENVMEAIGVLDRLHRTMISLNEGDDCYLLVAGPAGEGYLVNGTLNNRDFYSLKNINADDCEVMCFIGGQDGYFALSHFVPLKFVRRAVQYFLQHSTLCPDLDWYSRNGRGPRLGLDHSEGQ